MANYPTYDELTSGRLATRRTAALQAVRQADEKVRAEGGRALFPPCRAEQ